jgi:hypothetical protein
MLQQQLAEPMAGYVRCGFTAKDRAKETIADMTQHHHDHHGVCLIPA